MTISNAKWIEFFRVWNATKTAGEAARLLGLSLTGVHYRYGLACSRGWYFLRPMAANGRPEGHFGTYDDSSDGSYRTYHRDPTDDHVYVPRLDQISSGTRVTNKYGDNSFDEDPDPYPCSLSDRHFFTAHYAVPSDPKFGLIHERDL